jgi:cellulose synthase/poly-beta-1,6-N-acetylglucosamine synthase-like glycosyltransferase/peptidoglycan/xylan/chitin deacetylase (PgdA/CDA1 family)
VRIEEHRLYSSTIIAMRYLKLLVAALTAGMVAAAAAGPALAGAIYVPTGGSALTEDNLAQPDLPPKTVILTFDDGPSVYTPRILEILQQKHVHATFFVIGQQAVQTPILRRIYETGNDIGNHTYTHPDLAHEPWWRLLVELNLTRIMLESQTWHDSRLFRPPYLGSDAPPIDAAGTISQAGNLGYITAGIDVDTGDWRKPGVTQIVRQAENPAGGVVLLHDGGGDRRQTVEALPAIIDYYSARNFHFATVSQALSLPRDQVMTRLTPAGQAVAGTALVLFTAWAWSSHAVHWLILVMIAASFGRVIIVSAAALVQSRRRRYPKLPDQPPSCSVIIPAYNEEAVIESCVSSVLAASYPHLEVIVVDDGSGDNTAARAMALADPRLRVLSKPNGGKARALNFGIRHSRGQVIIAIDADTVFHSNTIPKLLRHFADRKVGAVSGNTKIINRHRLITKLQSLEYIIGFNLDRRMGDLFDCITVVPGAVGAFRRSALYDIGGFAPDTLAEDTDLTLAIKETGCRIVYDDQAVAFTEAPGTLRQLLQQRYRWTFGTMQAVYKHRRSLLNPHAGTVGLVGLPYLLFYQIVFPLLGPFFDLTLVLGLITHQYHLVLVSFLIYSLLDLLTAALAFHLDHEPLRQLWVLVPQRLFYRQLMYYVIARSAVKVLKGQLVRQSWDVQRDGLHLGKKPNDGNAQIRYYQERT